MRDAPDSVVARQEEAFDGAAYNVELLMPSGQYHYANLPGSTTIQEFIDFAEVNTRTHTHIHTHPFW